MRITLDVGTKFELDGIPMEVMAPISGCFACALLNEDACKMFECSQTSGPIFRVRIKEIPLSTAEAIHRLMEGEEVYSIHNEKGQGRVHFLMENVVDIVHAHDQGDTFFREVSK